MPSRGTSTLYSGFCIGSPSRLLERALQTLCASAPNVPQPILETAEHRVLNADERFTHFLCHSGAGGEHDTPLMHSSHT